MEMYWADLEESCDEQEALVVEVGETELAATTRTTTNAEEAMKRLRDATKARGGVHKIT